ncbi:unnamed protein product [Prorocentrum cordatum]|uniref:Uncharacterized protein n=1 Tax=Prorocentrum cordatum TaxID=2364126 RepID=A0ABN9SIZ0_9DINO|nr:unnamed protein product [Polarella glacialis]
MVVDAVRATNEMYTGSCCPRPTGLASPVVAQQKGLAVIQEAVDAFGMRPPDLAPAGALKELRVAQSYDQESAVIAPVAFDRVDLISLPSVGSEPKPLSMLIGGDSVSIGHRLQQLLLPRERGLARVAEHAPKRVRAGEMGISVTAGGQPVSPSQWVYPCFRCPPMGFSLSLWLCQTVNETVSRRAGLVRRLLLLLLVRSIIIYVQWVCLLMGWSGVGGETLGWAFDSNSPVISLNPRLRWKLYPGLQEILRRGYCSGKEMVRIVSHITSRVLIGRELLSCLGAVYKFGEIYRSRVAKLWPVVRRELCWARALLIFCSGDLGLPFDAAPTCLGASSWGFGVTQREVTLEARAGVMALKHKLRSKRWLPSEFNSADPASRNRPGARLMRRPAAAPATADTRSRSRRDRSQSLAALSWGDQATRRVARRLAFPAAAMTAATGVLTFLETQAVGEATRRDYEARVSKFETWASSVQLPISDATEMDSALVTFFNQLSFDGYPREEATKYMAAPVHFRAAPGRLQVAFPRAARAAKGWARLVPARSRLPLPWPIACLMIGWMLNVGEAIAAAATAVCFALYLRPAELLSLQREQVAPPAEGAPPGQTFLNFWSLVLRPMESLQPSRTGVYDEGLLLDSPEFTWLPMLLQCLSKFRSLGEIEKRGRWVSDSPLRRCTKGGRVAEQMRRPPVAEQRRATRLVGSIGGRLSGI